MVEIRRNEKNGKAEAWIEGKFVGEITTIGDMAKSEQGDFVRNGNSRKIQGTSKAKAP